MEEKIKINISKSLYEILLKDMELFEFIKNDGSLNKNLFLTTLINNYYLEYNDSVNKMNEIITHHLKESELTLKKHELIYLTTSITNELNTLTLNLNKQKFDKSISIKPTKQTLSTFAYIEKYLLKDTSTSSFFRSLIASYVKHPLDVRESIIFKKEYEMIQEAINKHQRIYFTIKKGNEVSPYKISSSKEELFNYVLALQGHTIMTFRLSRMKNISIINHPAVFTPNQKKCFEKMIELGPQYPIFDKALQDIVVRMTPRGEELFQTMYLHRPKLSKKEGNVYYFNCSHAQILQYFSRLVQHAIIIEPHNLRDTLQKSFQWAYYNYKDESDKLKSIDPK